MHLSQKEIDKLQLHNAGFLAQKRYARGLQLNYVEAVALIAAQILEFIRDGDSVASLMDKGKLLLGFADVLPGVDSLVDEVQVEGTFLDGTKLVTIHQPICREKGDPSLALYGSGLSRSMAHQVSSPMAWEGQGKPGEVMAVPGTRILNKGRPVTTILVTNHGDRPVQVGSHYPFFETNGALLFDRAKAYGLRLDIPAGTAVRFEPGETKRVDLVPIAGEQRVYGGNNLINGGLTNPVGALEQAVAQGFSHQEEG